MMPTQQMSVRITLLVYDKVDNVLICTLILVTYPCILSCQLLVRLYHRRTSRGKYNSKLSWQTSGQIKYPRLESLHSVSLRCASLP
jgi:hypothetical protein